MKDNQISLKRWLELFDEGAFDSEDVKAQIGAGWYDWFCKDSSLRNRTYKLAPKVKLISKSPRIDTEKTYVFFKNNCPVYGKLYDDFRICNLESGDVIYCITPKSGHPGGKAELWGKDNNFDGPIVSGAWDDIVMYMFDQDQEVK